MSEKRGHQPGENEAGRRPLPSVATQHLRTVTRSAFRAVIPLGLALMWSPGSVDAGPIEDAVEAQWRGVFVVLKAESRSGCEDTYTNNPAFGARLGGRGEHRLGPGELGQVKKVDVKRNRVDVFVDFLEPVRLAYVDGPFELYRHADCKIELQFEMPRASLKKAPPEELRGLFSEILERHETQSSVEASSLYNARRVEPFPEGYDAVLADYEIWKAEQFDAEVHDRLAQTLDEANRLANRVRSNPSYAEGFAAGLRYGGSSSFINDDCYDLLDKTFYAVTQSPPSSADDYDSSEWQSGNREGQALAFHLELARDLARCIR